MDESSRAAGKRLHAEKLPDAWQSEVAAISGQAEQARFVLLGSLGAIAVIATGTFATSKKVCLPFVELGFVLLMLAAIAGWTAFTLVAAAWDGRSTVRYAELQMLIATSQGEETEKAKSEYASALGAFGRTRSRIRIFTTAGAILGWWAAPALLEAIRETQTGACAASVASVLQKHLPSWISHLH